MSDLDVSGTVYLLHFAEPIGDLDNPVGSAQHYTGWYSSPLRIDHHRNGTSDVAIVSEFFRRGIPFVVARTRPGTKTDERRIKNAGGQARYCPWCTTNPRKGVWGDYVPSQDQGD